MRAAYILSTCSFLTTESSRQLVEGHPCNLAQPAQCVLCDVTLDPSQTEPLLELERSGVILPRDVRCCSGHGAQGRLQLRERRRVEPPELAAEE